MINDARDGVLLVDEAYTLADDAGSGSDFGKEAIDTLLKTMEDGRSRLAVIVDGYASPMNRFLDANPGLRSRFTRYINFEDYAPAELRQIIDSMFAGKELVPSDDASEKLEKVIADLYRRRDESFGNGREMRTLFERIAQRQAQRVTAAGLSADIARVESSDIPSDRDSVVDDVDALLAELDAMIGLTSVKTEIRDLVDLVRLNEHRAQEGLDPIAVSLHMVFTGNPGTGKTTVARLVGRILAGLGLLARGHTVETSRDKLVSGYQGQTAIKTAEALKDAHDGVLLVDEAYTLVDDDGSGSYGQEAIDTLLKAMEDDRARLAVIVDGYNAPMRKFLDANPGFESRFSRHINFDDFSPVEFREIIDSMFRDGHLEVSEAASSQLDKVIAELYRGRGEKFGNGRAMRVLYEKTAQRYARRLATATGKESASEMIEPDDIPSDRAAVVADVDALLAELDAMIGLDEVKLEIRKLVSLVRLNTRRVNEGQDPVPVSLHMVFAGNPGTGKTTVANLLGQILAGLGLLRRGHVVVAPSNKLVAGYVGQTAIKTNEVINEALDGVLFIDEAYALTSGTGSGNDFGSEAITAVLLAMEEKRDRLAVVAAGYTKPMEDFVASNAGLKSRFSRVLNFADYNPDQLMEIYRGSCTQAGLQLEPGAADAARTLFEVLWANRGVDFGNGRLARSQFEATFERQAMRLMSEPEADLHILTAADIPTMT